MRCGRAATPLLGLLRMPPSPSRWVAAPKRLAKQVAFELLLHRERAREKKRRPTVVIFPSNQRWDPASRLRAWEVAPELRRLGWRVVVVPEPLSLTQRRRILRLEQPDAIWMQQTRHPLNRAELYAPIPVVLDADDADYLDPRIQGQIARTAEASAAVVGGSRFVADCLGRHNDDATIIWTAAPPALPPRTRPHDRGPIVAWAHASPLGYPQEAALMREVMTALARRVPFTFWLFGTREDDAAEFARPIVEAGAKVEAIPYLPYDEYVAKVSEAAIGVQPVCLESEFSRGKSFGKILAYLSGQVAVVASNAVDHPLFFRHGESGMLVDDVQSWVAALESLLRDPDKREAMALAAYRDFETKLTTRAFAAQANEVLRRAAKLDR